MKPILVVMAAGMGSRFGGMKQVEAVGPGGSPILDYSVYDAIQAGFGKVVFVIKEEHREIFEERFGKKMRGSIEVDYAYQSPALPSGYAIPEGRSKPWGTGHAVLSAAGKVDAPFAVINADDYYGPAAFRKIADFFSAEQDGCAMVGYSLKNTVTENGSVSRGICSIEESGYLKNVTERTRIETVKNGIIYIENDEEHILSPDSIVSMNFWGFSDKVFPYFEKYFKEFLTSELPSNPIKAEFYLPSAATKLITEHIYDIKVLFSDDCWYGITYREDTEKVRSALKKMHSDNIYPAKLF